MKKFHKDDDWIKQLFEYLKWEIWNLDDYKIVNSNYISAIFLAWAPWAWKTEFLDTIFTELKENFIIIDIDKYRDFFIWYNWDNSSEYQNASVKVADKILKYCFKNQLNFIFDWTFRNFNKVSQNFNQCKKYHRKSLITFIYQEPRISFYYTFLRKLDKKRNVPIEVFIDWFYDSIFNVFKAIKIFTDVDLIIAHKKYNPLNKNQSKFLIDYKTKTIKKFTTKYKISYENWLFKNKEKLRLDLINFQDILVREFQGTGTILWKIHIWFKEKTWKIF